MCVSYQTTEDDARIEEALKKTGAKLLILDPLSSYMGDCQLNAANEVRPRFNHLIRIARETGAAIVFSVGEDGISFIKESELTADELLASFSDKTGRPDRSVVNAQEKTGRI